MVHVLGIQLDAFVSLCSVLGAPSSGFLNDHLKFVFAVIVFIQDCFTAIKLEIYLPLLVLIKKYIK